MNVGYPNYGVCQVLCDTPIDGSRLYLNRHPASAKPRISRVNGNNFV